MTGMSGSMTGMSGSMTGISGFVEALLDVRDRHILALSGLV
jgi:hypothetical protein